MPLPSDTNARSSISYSKNYIHYLFDLPEDPRETFHGPIDLRFKDKIFLHVEVAAIESR